MRRSFRFLAVLACAMPLACADTNTTPTGTAPPEPRLSANLGESRVVVSRGTTGLMLGWDDPTNGLTVFHTAFDLHGWFCTFDPGPQNWLSYKALVSGQYPYETTLVHYLAKQPEIYINVYATGGTDFCTEIATGTGKFVQTNNDMLADVGGRPQTQASGMMVEGRLVGADGQLYHYNGHFRATWRPADLDGSYHEQVMINLQPIAQ